MDARNGSTASRRTEAQVLSGLDTVDISVDTTKRKPIHLLFERFDDTAMQKSGPMLGLAGRKLNEAYQASYAIAGLTTIVRANGVEGSDYHSILNEREEDQILCAVGLLADMLLESLCDAADFVDETLSDTKGGT